MYMYRYMYMGFVLGEKWSEDVSDFIWQSLTYTNNQPKPVEVKVSTTSTVDHLEHFADGQTRLEQS